VLVNLVAEKHKCSFCQRCTERFV